MTDPQRIQKAEQAYKMVTVMQYAAPLVLLALALFLPVLADLGNMRDMIAGLLCIVALLDFLLIRFILLPRVKQNLERAKEGA